MAHKKKAPKKDNAAVKKFRLQMVDIMAHVLGSDRCQTDKSFRDFMIAKSKFMRASIAMIEDQP